MAVVGSLCLVVGVTSAAEVHYVYDDLGRLLRAEQPNSARA